MLPDSTLIIGLIPELTIDTVESKVYDLTHPTDEEDAEFADFESALLSLCTITENVEHWRIEENEDGIWSDDVETYDSMEEAIQCNTPAQFLTNF